MSQISPQKISSLFPSRWDQGYVASKLRTDPLYSALAGELADSPLPLLDLGCGLGLLAFFLRDAGVKIPIIGLDYDDRKIESANRAMVAGDFTDISFIHFDARKGLPEHLGNVSILDILQFFTKDEQTDLLNQAAQRVAPGGKLVIRSGLRDASARFKITVAGDFLAKATFWMKAAPTHYPAARDLEQILCPYGEVLLQPLWGKTPFNNYLIVLKRT